METTFIYILIDPTTNQVRYVGKSNNVNKRLEGHLLDTKKTYKANWIKSLKAKDLKPILETIDEVLKEDWKFWEQHYICLYKSWGFNLTNATAGGEGMLNCSNEVREKMRLAKLGKYGSLSNKFGKAVDEEGKKKMSKFRKNKTYEEIHGSKEAANLVRLNQSKTRRGKPKSEEHKQKMKQCSIDNDLWFKKGQTPWNKGIQYSDERKASMSIITKALMTEERKEKIRQSVKATLAKKKQLKK